MPSQAAELAPRDAELAQRRGQAEAELAATPGSEPFPSMPEELRAELAGLAELLVQDGEAQLPHTRWGEVVQGSLPWSGMRGPWPPAGTSGEQPGLRPERSSAQW